MNSTACSFGSHVNLRENSARVIKKGATCWRQVDTSSCAPNTGANLYLRNQPRTYLLNQSIVRCQAKSAAALLYRSGVASQLKPCTAPA
jgi:hypothetical protein